MDTFSKSDPSKITFLHMMHFYCSSSWKGPSFLFLCESDFPGNVLPEASLKPLLKDLQMGRQTCSPLHVMRQRQEIKDERLGDFSWKIGIQWGWIRITVTSYYIESTFSTSNLSSWTHLGSCRLHDNLTRAGCVWEWYLSKNNEHIVLENQTIRCNDM